MTCWYKFFTRMKMTKKGRRKGSDIICEHQYLHIGCKLKKARYLKPLKLIMTILIFFNHKMFTFLMLLEHVQSLTLDFKFYIIQMFSISVKLIACEP
jgi:hypothetical protein